uniref:Uncharacterized protein n=1 Tax=Anguilla anguilla TaxID=7936 RepID=A0A0E9UD00_ANGAN
MTAPTASIPSARPAFAAITAAVINFCILAFWSAVNSCPFKATVTRLSSWNEVGQCLLACSN